MGFQNNPPKELNQVLEENTKAMHELLLALEKNGDKVFKQIKKRLGRLNEKG